MNLSALWEYKYRIVKDGNGKFLVQIYKIPTPFVDPMFLYENEQGVILYGVMSVANRFGTVDAAEIFFKKYVIQKKSAEFTEVKELTP